MNASSSSPAPVTGAQTPPPDHPMRSVVRVFGLFRRVMEPYFARHGISGSQWGVLRALVRAEEDDGRPSIRLTDLSDRLLIRPPSVTGVVDRLQRLGLVQRAASTNDQRVKQVRLTPAGRRLVRRVLRNHAAQIESVLAGLEQDERRELQRLLARLGDHLQTMVDGPLKTVSSRVLRVRT